MTRKESEVTLLVSQEPCQQELCEEMSEKGQTTKEKSELCRGQRLETQRLTIHSQHAVVAVPHLKCSPTVRYDRFWFHMAHLTEKRPTGMSGRDKFLVLGCSIE